MRTDPMYLAATGGFERDPSCLTAQIQGGRCSEEDVLCMHERMYRCLPVLASRAETRRTFKLSGLRSCRDAGSQLSNTHTVDSCIFTVVAIVHVRTKREYTVQYSRRTSEYHTKHPAGDRQTRPQISDSGQRVEFPDFVMTHPDSEIRVTVSEPFLRTDLRQGGYNLMIGNSGRPRGNLGCRPSCPFPEHHAPPADAREFLGQSRLARVPRSDHPRVSVIRLELLPLGPNLESRHFACWSDSRVPSSV